MLFRFFRNDYILEVWLRVYRNIRVPPIFAHSTPYQEVSSASAFVVTGILRRAPKYEDAYDNPVGLVYYGPLWSVVAVRSIRITGALESAAFLSGVWFS